MTDHVGDILDGNKGIYHDTHRFAVFTQLARLLAAEDIIVRWNVRGLGAPASMQMAGRILDVAPIKKEEEDKIPGLIFHEVAHFIFTDDYSKALEDAKMRIKNTEKLEELKRAIKDKHLWNLIEDGYIERRAVVRWPGTLKHFRVLYEDDLKHFKKSGDLVMDTINTLHLNVLGVKWGERHAYNKRLSQSLLDLLEEARMVMGDTLDRAHLSSKIFDELKALMPKPEPKKTIIEKMIPPEHTIDMGDEEDEGDVTPAEPLPEPKEPTAEEKKAVAQELEKIKDVVHANTVDALAAVDVTKEQTKVKVEDTTPKEEPPVKEPPKPKEEPPEEQPKEPTPQPEDDEPDIDEEGMLSEFISDNAAKILGSNLYYMEHLVEADTGGSERFVPDMNEILATSLVLDILPQFTKDTIKGRTFNRFVNQLQQSVSDEPNRAARRLTDMFLKKIEQSKVIAQSMFQRFTTKANARNIALTRYKKTGSLDPTRASLYQIYDDVFQRKQMAPQQVNHGYVMMVDWSASMRDSTMEMFHRVIELVQFARLANVELEVWLFTTEDGRISSAHLHEIKDEMRDNLLLTGSRFIKVVSTRESNPDETLYRLFAFFLTSAIHKGQRNLVDDGMVMWRRTHIEPFIHSHQLTQNGTNTFEALNFGKMRVQQMRSERKGILLVTDGDDAGGWQVTLKKTGGDRKDNTDDILSNTASKVYMGRVDLLEYGRAAQSHLEAGDNKYGFSNNPFKNYRTTASFLTAEEARKNGISVVGITWGFYTNASLVTITRSNVVRAQIPLGDLRTRNLGKYEPVKNTFITSITEALLSNIRK